jgi:AraC-like DNA-binding protein
MIYAVDEKFPESRYIEAISHGVTTSAGTSVRPAENCWHMVLSKHNGGVHLLVVGPLTTSGVVSYGATGEILWIKFRVGTYMPHLPVKEFIDHEAPLPGAATHSFWLKGSAWQFPSYDNADVFVDRLVREEILVHDPLVSAVLREEPHDLSPRTVRHRFLQATGVTQNHIRQVERAQQAAALLRSGISILDTVDELGYYDQPHLTRSLKQWVGHTPAQLQPASCRFVQDNAPAPDYNEVIENEDIESNVLTEIQVA